MEKYILSQMSRQNFSKAVNEIYLLTDYNNLQYPDYWRWYYRKNIPRLIEGKGDIICYLDGLVVADVAILKRDLSKSKICTLMVNEEYRKKGHGKELIESAFDYLGTDKPVITIPTNRLDEFSHIIQVYDWKEIERTDQYFSEEVIFNGQKVLQKKR